MSYGDIEEARAKRAAKEQATASKGKSGRKCKNPVAPGTVTKRARRSELEVAEDEIAAAGMEEHCSVLQL
jgi:hypothetical protein